MHGLTCEHLVEDVVVSLIRCVTHNPGLLQEVLSDVGPGDDAAVELDLNVLAEPGRVVVAQGLGVSEALQDRGSLKDLFRDLKPGPISIKDHLETSN